MTWTAPLSVNVGAAVSVTFTLRVTDAGLPLGSETEYRTLYSPGTLTLTVPLTVIDEVRFPPHVSLAVAPGSLNTPLQATDIGLAPTTTRVGAVASITLTVRVTGTAGLPEGSLTV